MSTSIRAKYDMSDAFICDAIRTPIGTFRRGPFVRTHRRPGAIPIAELMRRNPKVDWARWTT
jgi:16S rRNA C967 or C1407 C5-methylase (RsmB/RsmF family)